MYVKEYQCKVPQSIAVEYKLRGFIYLEIAQNNHAIFYKYENLSEALSQLKRNPNFAFIPYNIVQRLGIEDE